LDSIQKKISFRIILEKIKIKYELNILKEIDVVLLRIYFAKPAYL